MAGRKPIPLIVAGLLALLFIVLAALIYSASSKAARFDRNGVETSAIFLSGRTVRYQSQPEKPVRYRHYATVRFEAGGQVVTAEAEVTEDFLRAHDPGARVPVTYLPDDPQTVLVDPLHESRGLALAWMFLIFFAGALLWPLWQRWRTRGAPPRPSPERAPRPKAGPMPRWVRLVSIVLMLCALGSFFTLSVWLRYAVEAWALPHVGWVSLPLGMAAMLVPPVGFGLANLTLIWGVQRFGRAAG
ncbi:DUF3592 domain-containing protein [Mameliella alba]|nr:DUF3592 domain-containing protein [Antarctobacter heliothermus]MBY6142925.1 DUF3592 domain-containing protein [Mameliella alba]MCA0953350.1 DUF3592 domain-containing protein [Mameliella alba]